MIALLLLARIGSCGTGPTESPPASAGSSFCSMASKPVLAPVTLDARANSLMTNYADQTVCGWLISATTPGCTVMLNTLSFMVDVSDTLEVFSDAGALTSLGTFTGNSGPAGLTGVGPNLFVRFTTDASVNSQGFVLSASESCSVALTMTATALPTQPPTPSYSQSLSSSPTPPVVTHPCGTPIASNTTTATISPGNGMSACSWTMTAPTPGCVLSFSFARWRNPNPLPLKIYEGTVLDESKWLMSLLDGSANPQRPISFTTAGPSAYISWEAVVGDPMTDIVVSISEFCGAPVPPRSTSLVIGTDAPEFTMSATLVLALVGVTSNNISRSSLFQSPVGCGWTVDFGTPVPADSTISLIDNDTNQELYSLASYTSVGPVALDAPNLLITWFPAGYVTDLPVIQVTESCSNTVPNTLDTSKGVARWSDEQSDTFLHSFNSYQTYGDIKDAFLWATATAFYARITVREYSEDLQFQVSCGSGGVFSTAPNSRMWLGNITDSTTVPIYIDAWDWTARTLGTQSILALHSSPLVTVPPVYTGSVTIIPHIGAQKAVLFTIPWSSLNSSLADYGGKRTCTAATLYADATTSVMLDYSYSPPFPAIIDTAGPVSQSLLSLIAGAQVLPGFSFYLNTELGGVIDANIPLINVPLTPKITISQPITIFGSGFGFDINLITVYVNKNMLSLNTTESDLLARPARLVTSTAELSYRSFAEVVVSVSGFESAATLIEMNPSTALTFPLCNGSNLPSFWQAPPGWLCDTAASTATLTGITYVGHSRASVNLTLNVPTYDPNFQYLRLGILTGSASGGLTISGRYVAQWMMEPRFGAEYTVRTALDSPNVTVITSACSLESQNVILQRRETQTESPAPISCTVAIKAELAWIEQVTISSISLYYETDTITTELRLFGAFSRVAFLPPLVTLNGVAYSGVIMQNFISVYLPPSVFGVFRVSVSIGSVPMVFLPGADDVTIPERVSVRPCHVISSLGNQLVNSLGLSHILVAYGDCLQFTDNGVYSSALDYTAAYPNGYFVGTADMLVVVMRDTKSEFMLLTSSSVGGRLRVVVGIELPLTNAMFAFHTPLVLQYRSSYWPFVLDYCSTWPPKSTLCQIYAAYYCIYTPLANYNGSSVCAKCALDPDWCSEASAAVCATNPSDSGCNSADASLSLPSEELRVNLPLSVRYSWRVQVPWNQSAISHFGVIATVTISSPLFFDMNSPYSALFQPSVMLNGYRNTAANAESLCIPAPRTNYTCRIWLSLSGYSNGAFNEGTLAIQGDPLFSTQATIRLDLVNNSIPSTEVALSANVTAPQISAPYRLFHGVFPGVSDGSSTRFLLSINAPDQYSDALIALQVFTKDNSFRCDSSRGIGLGCRISFDGCTLNLDQTEYWIVLFPVELGVVSIAFSAEEDGFDTLADVGTLSTFSEGSFSLTARYSLPAAAPLTLSLTQSSSGFFGLEMVVCRRKSAIGPNNLVRDTSCLSGSTCDVPLDNYFLVSSPGVLYVTFRGQGTEIYFDYSFQRTVLNCTLPTTTDVCTPYATYPSSSLVETFNPRNTLNFLPQYVIGTPSTLCVETVSRFLCAQDFPACSDVTTGLPLPFCSTMCSLLNQNCQFLPGVDPCGNLVSADPPLCTPPNSRSLNVTLSQVSPNFLHSRNASTLVSVVGSGFTPGMNCRLNTTTVSIMIAATVINSTNAQCLFPPGFLPTISGSSELGSFLVDGSDPLPVTLFRAPNVLFFTPLSGPASSGPNPVTQTVQINFTLDASLPAGLPAPLLEWRMRESTATTGATVSLIGPLLSVWTTFNLPGTYDGFISFDGGINFDLGTGQPFSATWDPPSLQSAYLSPTGASIDISFNFPTNQPASTNCVGLVEFPPLGVSIRCLWSGPQNLQVTLGAGATVLPGDMINVKGNAIRAYTAYTTTQTLPFVQSSVSLTAPEVPAPVIALIVAPSTVGVCSNTTLSAANSGGSGGRPWASIQWTVSVPAPPASGYDENLTTALQNWVSNFTGLSLVLGPTDLQPGVQYSFSVVMTNFLGASSSTSTLVNKSGLPLPQVFITAGQFINAVRSRPLALAGRAFLSPCYGSTSNLRYSWSQLSGPPIFLNPLTASSRQTLIPAYTLSVGTTSVFQLTASYANNPSINASDIVTVTVLSQPLGVAILGGDRSISAGSASTVSALVTDPDGESTPISYTWDIQLLGVSQGTSTNSLFVLPLLSPGEYSVTLTVQRGVRFASATSTLFVVPGAIPEVFITPMSGKLNPSMPLVLSAITTGNVSLCWDSYDGLDLSDTSGLVLTSRYQSVLKLAPGSLQGGATYTFVVFTSFSAFGSVGCENAVGEARVTVVANSPPSMGSIAVSPSSGVSLDTLFTVVAPNWNDDPEDLPLSYEFLAETSTPGRFATVIAPQPQPERTTILVGPPDAVSIVRVRVLVTDRWGASSVSETTVTLIPAGDSSASALVGRLNGQFGDLFATRDTDALFTLLITLLDTQNQNAGNTTGSATRRQVSNNSGDQLRAQALSVLQQLLGETDFEDGDPLTTFSRILAQTAEQPTDMQSSTFEEFFRQLAELVAVAEGGISVEQAGLQLFTAMSNAVSYSAHIREESGNNTGASGISATVSQQLASLLAQQLKAAVCGERATVNAADNVAARAQKVVAGSLDGSTLSAEPGLNGTVASFGLPASFSSILGTTACVASHLVTWSPNPFSEGRNATILSDVVTIRFTDQDGVEIPVSNSDNITFTLPVTKVPNPTNASALLQDDFWRCVFYIPRNDSWSKSGCVLVERTSTHISCACSHLTDFATQFKETYRNATAPDITDVSNFSHIKDRLGTVGAAIAILGLTAIFYWLGQRWDEHQLQKMGGSEVNKTAESIAVEEETKAMEGQRVEIEMTEMGVKTLPADTRPWYMRWKRNPNKPPDTRPFVVKAWSHVKKNHLIVSYFFRDPRDVFTRPQRALCICVILLGDFAINAAFYGVGSQTDPVSIVATGIATALIMVPLSFFLPILFKTLRGQPTLRIFKRQVPRWTRFVPYTVSCLLILLFTYLVIVYGVSFTKAVEQSWLVSTLWSVGQDNVLQEPLFGMMRESVRQLLISALN
eukprot:TRINITY_DN6268_c0_g1_i1.p1 TRINITY_DN6268_c0_g1~~TRINITY_DN6268_c0_g1_i1.p1  ORF type:complete len:3072 (-),score=457.76 TRINITY_DN6268_c0_g1_i1:89-9304(-)